jgi:hypothetical protein
MSAYAFGSAPSVARPRRRLSTGFSAGSAERSGNGFVTGLRTGGSFCSSVSRSQIVRFPIRGLFASRAGDGCRVGQLRSFEGANLQALVCKNATHLVASNVVTRPYGLLAERPAGKHSYLLRDVGDIDLSQTQIQFTEFVA